MEVLISAAIVLAVCIALRDIRDVIHRSWSKNVPRMRRRIARDSVDEPIGELAIGPLVLSEVRHAV